MAGSQGLFLPSVSIPWDKKYVNFFPFVYVFYATSLNILYELLRALSINKQRNYLLFNYLCHIFSFVHGFAIIDDKLSIHIKENIDVGFYAFCTELALDRNWFLGLSLFG